ncbi:Fur family transcriptional regulator [Aliikangiella coralliicola]|uniref:Transcriptional repressor n=1 Tax=Aliikangiella coralliicola TaxID=2592383 RepID=A0A545UGP3_9GAMM|nr:transcriptional repressor [Aliikangiella coralliicola]TQV88573.1 transcriptional repressor [Aliikangiella coralliicola]
MAKVDKVLDHAEQHCTSLGVRLTQKRKQVLTVLLLSRKALSAYELIDVYKKEFGDTLPAMSAYRILDFLQGKDLVHKLNLTNKYVACSCIDNGHVHAVSQFLICKKCQKVSEVNINQSTILEFQKNVEDAGFRLVSSQLEMNCICESCIANEP